MKQMSKTWPLAACRPCRPCRHDVTRSGGRPALHHWFWRHLLYELNSVSSGDLSGRHAGLNTRSGRSALGLRPAEPQAYHRSLTGPITVGACDSR